MVFTSARKKYDANVVDNRIQLNDKLLHATIKVYSTKFLGLYINENLN